MAGSEATNQVDGDPKTTDKISERTKPTISMGIEGAKITTTIVKIGRTDNKTVNNAKITKIFAEIYNATSVGTRATSKMNAE